MTDWRVNDCIMIEDRDLPELHGFAVITAVAPLSLLVYTLQDHDRHWVAQTRVRLLPSTVSTVLLRNQLLQRVTVHD